MTIDRRTFLKGGLLTAGALGVHALTGSRSRLGAATSTKARAQEALPPHTLILCTSSAGDPVNANAPGTYEDPRVQHPDDPRMAPTPLILGDSSSLAAKPWADLPESIRSRMAFVHHGTYTNIHPNQPDVMRLMGAVEDNEMFVSFLAAELAPRLDCVQTEPVSIGANVGSELLAFHGRRLANVTPMAIVRSLKGTGVGSLYRFRDMRDARLDRLHEIYREHSTSNQARFVERLDQTRASLRSIPGHFLDLLSDVGGNRVEHQVVAASVLAAMNIAPVITIHLPFGGDNHDDTEFRFETEQTITGVALLQDLIERLDTLRADGILRQPVTVASLNVFGRDLARRGRLGRDHNGRHHAAFIIGDNVTPGVYGGITPFGQDFEAQAIDSTTGAADPEGDIPHAETLQSLAKTMGSLLGVPRERLDEGISGGKYIEPLSAHA